MGKRWALARLVVIAATAGGCIAPVSVGSPEPSRTLGRGHFGGTARLEMPSLNLISDESGDSLQEEGFAAPIVGMEGGYGVADRVDLEAGVDMPLYFFIVPIPTTIWIGPRVGVVDTGEFTLALSGRVGGLALGKVEGDVETDEEATASFWMLGMSTSVAAGPTRPGIALRYSRYDVSTSGVENVAPEFDASIATATAYLALPFGAIDVVPYFNIARFDSPNVDGIDPWFSGGLALRVGSRSTRGDEPALQPIAPY